MSHTPVQAFGTYNPKTNTAQIILGGTHYTLEGESAIEGYRALSNYRKSQDQETFDLLVDSVSPRLRLIENLFNGSFYQNEDTGAYFMEGTSVPLPEAVVNLLQQYEENDFPLESISNFWSLCLLNPNEDARDRFLQYCLDYNIVITDMGYAVLYKAVTHKHRAEKDEDLAAFVAEQVTTVKRHRKSPSGYHVYRVPNSVKIGNGDIIQPGFFASQTDYSDNDAFESLGTLQELHDNIEELSVKSGTVYTDKHTRKMDIHLGVPQFKPRSECDPNINNECSYGLHVGSYQYVKRFARPDDTILVTLVNPANVVALPAYDSSKIRVCEYYPYSVMERTEEDFVDDDGILHRKGTWFELEHNYFESDYAAYEVEDLKKGMLSEEQGVEEVVVSRMQQIEQYAKSDLTPKEEAPDRSVDRQGRFF